MKVRNRTGDRNNAFGRIGGVVAAGVAAACLAVASPAFAHDSDSILTIGGDDNLLGDLIELDAEGIQNLREEFAEARADIKDAIADIEKAREEAKASPGGGAIVEVAFNAARAATSGAVKSALAEAREEIDDAERELARMDVSPEERVETQKSIDVLREEFAGLEEALEELLAALKA